MKMTEIKCKNCGSVDFVSGGLEGIGSNLECKHCGTMYVLESDEIYPGTLDYGPVDFMSATSWGFGSDCRGRNPLGWRSRW